METWGAALYGDPCRECGFGFGLTPDQAVAAVRAVPVAFAERLAAATGREQLSGLAWNTAAYTSHVTDNLRVWAGALWSLRWAVDAWVQIVPEALTGQIVLQHATRGRQRAEDIARNNAHDAHHHLWDIDRILRAQ